jgi:hypothetical protein
MPVAFVLIAIILDLLVGAGLAIHVRRRGASALATWLITLFGEAIATLVIFLLAAFFLMGTSLAVSGSAFIYVMIFPWIVVASVISAVPVIAAIPLDDEDHPA